MIFRILLFAVAIAIMIMAYHLVFKSPSSLFVIRRVDKRMRWSGKFSHGFMKEVERILVDEEISNAQIRGYRDGGETLLDITGDAGIDRAEQRIRNAFQILS